MCGKVHVTFTRYGNSLHPDIDLFVSTVILRCRQLSFRCQGCYSLVWVPIYSWDRTSESHFLPSSANTLSGSRARLQEKMTPVIRIFRLQDKSNHPEIQSTRNRMILIGLISGAGIINKVVSMWCGITRAHGLSECGFGDSLYTAATNLSHVQLAEFVVTWRQHICHELRTNSRGKIGRKQLSGDFPDIDILFFYVRPITSENLNRESNKEPDLGKLAGLCELYFEWGYKESVMKRFRMVLWHSMTLRIVRYVALLWFWMRAPKFLSLPYLQPREREKEAIQTSGTLSKMMAELVYRSWWMVFGSWKRKGNGGPIDPETHLRLWMPA